MKSLTLIRGAAMTGALTLLHASGALAAGSGENTRLNISGTGISTHSSSGSSGIVRTIVGLFIVIAVIYGVAWVLRQVKGRGARPTGHGLSQVASLPLANGRSVALVRAGSELVLLGVAEHGVTPIRTYTEDEAIELGLELPPTADGDPEGGFAGGGPLGAGASRLADTLRRMTVRS